MRGRGEAAVPLRAEYKQGACNIFRALHPAKELHDNASIGHLDPRLGLVHEKNGDPLLRRTGATPACKSVWGDDAAWDMNGNLDEWVDDEKGHFVGGFFSRSKRNGCELQHHRAPARVPRLLDWARAAAGTRGTATRRGEHGRRRRVVARRRGGPLRSRAARRPAGPCRRSPARR